MTGMKNRSREPHFTLSMAEDDLKLTRRGTVVGEAGAVVGVGEGGGASVLEELRIARSPACRWTVVMSPATKLVRAVRLAPALARDHVTVRPLHLLPGRASSKQVLPAPHHRTPALPLMRGHRQRHVEAVHQTHAVGGMVVLGVVEAELDQGGRCFPSCAVALQPASAVAGEAGEVTAIV